MVLLSPHEQALMLVLAAPPLPPVLHCLDVGEILPVEVEVPVRLDGLEGIERR